MQYSLHQATGPNGLPNAQLNHFADAPNFPIIRRTILSAVCRQRNVCMHVCVLCAACCRIANRMIHRMATDKVMWILSAALVVTIIFIIVYHVAVKKSWSLRIHVYNRIARNCFVHKLLWVNWITSMIRLFKSMKTCKCTSCLHT